MPVQVECCDVVKRFGTVTVLDHLDWTVQAGSVVGLLGGSGAGKTTLLRVIAGLEECDAGRVSFHSADGTHTSRRPVVGMVFQNLALWPHLTARQHVACVMPPVARAKRRRRAEEVLAETRLAPQAWDRPPGELSGGEAQRVALARALAHGPELLLLDEPLAQVDTPLRAALLELIDECVQARGATAVYVTHAWREAMRIGRRLAVLQRGRVVLEGTPEEVYWDLSDPEVARLTGPVVELRRDWLAEGLITPGEGIASTPDAPSDRSGILVIRPQQLHVIEPEGRNRWTPVAASPEGAGWMGTLEKEGRQLRVASIGPLVPGEAVGVKLVGPGGFGRPRGTALHSPEGCDKRRASGEP
jgi:ABC-type sulfate/molybdate transport systems ATPase subunit